MPQRINTTALRSNPIRPAGSARSNGLQMEKSREKATPVSSPEIAPDALDRFQRRAPVTGTINCAIPLRAANPVDTIESGELDRIRLR